MPANQPNVVIMLADNLGFGDLQCYGGAVPTPRLDALASDGTRLTNFNTEAQCTPTRGALLTGRLPVRSGTFRVPLPGEPGDYGLSPWEYTMGDLFTDAGYATACYGKWHLGNVAGRFPTDQGFDEWWGISESSDEAAYTAHELYPATRKAPAILQSKRGETPTKVADFDLATRRYMDEQIADRAVSFINSCANRRSPFFSYVAWTNVHPPMLAHPDFGTDTANPLPANIAELDHRAGQVLDALESNGIADNTIVIWASDNAAALLQGTAAGSNGPWRGYFGGGWEGSIRTPCIVRWPGHVSAGRTTDAIVATYDLLPTLAAMIEQEGLVPDDRPIDGVDLTAFLTSDDPPPSEHFVFLGTDGQPVAVKWKTMKVHFRYTESDSWTAPLVTPQIPAVYDLLADPAETQNLMDIDLTVTWVVGEAMRELVALERSATEYPHVEVGADFSGYD